MIQLILISGCSVFFPILIVSRTTELEETTTSLQVDIRSSYIMDCFQRIIRILHVCEGMDRLCLEDEACGIIPSDTIFI